MVHNTQDQEFELYFAIVQLKDRTDPDPELWAFSNESYSYGIRYFIADQFPTGQYKILIPPSLQPSFCAASKTAGMCKFTQ